MKSSTGILASMQATRPTDWYQATLLLIYALVGGLAPLWLGSLIALIYGKTPTLTDFASNGEFTLYCASIVAPALYVVLHERTERRLHGQTLLGLFAVILLLLAITGYVAAVPVTREFLASPSLDKEIYARASCLLFVIGVSFTLLVTALDNARTLFDIRDIANQQQQDLARKFDNLGGQL